MAHGLFSLQFLRFSFALGGFCQFLPFNGLLCNFLSFPLLWAASATNAEKVVLSRFPSDLEHVTNKSTWHMAYFLCNVQSFPLLCAASAKMLVKLQFPCFSHCRTASLLWFHCAKGTKPSFFSTIAKVSCVIWACHYTQTDGIWLSFSAIFKVFLCVGRLLPNCWKSCSFHPFNGFRCRFLIFPLLLYAPSGTTAEKVAISMLFPLQQSITFMIPVSFVHCQGFLRNWSMTLHTNRWHMACFSAIFKVFLCIGRLLL